MAQRALAIEHITSAISHLTRVTGSCGLPEHLNRTLLEVEAVLTEVQSEISRVTARK